MATQQKNKNYSEIFQRIQTIPDLLDYAVSHYSDVPVIRSKNKDSEKAYTYEQLRQEAICLASHLVQKSISARHIAIIGNLSYEWFVIYFGIMFSGNVAVPIDWQLNENEIAKLIRQADIDLLCMDASYTKKAVNLQTEFAGLAGWAGFISYGEDNNGDISGYDNVRQYCGRINSDQKGACARRPIHPEQGAMLIFTSGTTGNSKAVLLSHKNICDNLCCCAHIIGDIFTPPGCIIPVLPPHHMFQVTTGLLMPLYYGGTICFGGGLKYIAQNVKYFQPVAMIAVPLVVETLYKKICQEIKRKGKERQMQWAIRISNLLRLLKIDLRSWLFKDIQASFGGKMKILICGGAFLDRSLVTRFDEWGISLRNGYGITECSPVVSCNMEKRQRLGSVGVIAPSPYCQVKISDGEVLVQGTIVMKDYYNDEEATKQAFAEGWFKTGDLGTIDDDGFLFITGRKKNLLILADGNNISPEELEIPLERSPLIKSVLICSKQHHKSELITACIYPDYEYANEMGLTDIQAELEREVAGLNASLPPYKRVQIVEICKKDFEKTALGKIKRYKYKTD